MQKMLNLPVRADVPVVAIISRLVAHKGLDLVRHAIESLLSQDVQIVILGKGEIAYENFFKHMAYVYKGKCVSIIAYNQDLSRKIYSGADIFLMPSIAEPCGLSQMIASRYGSVPLVRRTGGLADSIVDFTVKGNGYTFDNVNAEEMYTVLKRAISDFYDQNTWPEKVKKVMSVDFGWTKSAKEYIKMYNELLG
jgi:starch synthase